MRLSIFMVAAVVLIVFGIVAGAAHNGLCFGVQWFVWFMASFLAYLADVITGGWAPWTYTRSPVQPQ